MAWAEYLPEDNVFEEAGEACPFATADRYQATAVISRKNLSGERSRHKGKFLCTMICGRVEFLCPP